VRIFSQLAKSRRVWALLFVCGAGLTGFAAYRLYVLRPVIRSINAVGGICDFDHSSRLVPFFASWLAVDTDLQKICIELCAIPDPVRHHLHALPKLARFIVVRGTITDADLEALGNSAGLTEIWLAQCHFIDPDFGHISRLKNLRNLGLNASGITDRGLEPLSAIQSLEHLSIADSPISDAGLVHLARLPRLSSLELRGTEITDAGLTLLAGLKKLQTLDVTGTAPAGIAALKQALPGCTVIGP
jgi:Leucine-rich repeat (LRR) protein